METSPEPWPLPRKVLFFIAALPAVLRAAWRVRRLASTRLDVAAGELRRVPRLWWRALERPGYLAASADRLVDYLPPRRYGRCLKRSLLLLDLWSRCGLRPTLHLGARLPQEPLSPSPPRSDETERCHAWVTCGDDGPRTDDAGHLEIWSG